MQIRPTKHRIFGLHQVQESRLSLPAEDPTPQQRKCFFLSHHMELETAQPSVSWLCVCACMYWWWHLDHGGLRRPFQGCLPSGNRRPCSNQPHRAKRTFCGSCVDLTWWLGPMTTTLESYVHSSTSSNHLQSIPHNAETRSGHPTTVVYKVLERLCKGKLGEYLLSYWIFHT